MIAILGITMFQEDKMARGINMISETFCEGGVYKFFTFVKLM